MMWIKCLFLKDGQIDHDVYHRPKDPVSDSFHASFTTRFNAYAMIPPSRCPAVQVKTNTTKDNLHVDPPDLCHQHVTSWKPHFITANRLSHDALFMIIRLF